MGGKQMEGDEQERRKLAKEAKEEGKRPSEVGATQGANQQRTEAKPSQSHQQKVDLQREGKQEDLTENTPEARPGSRDDDSLDRESHPRL
jgi:hypothetical protein